MSQFIDLEDTTSLEKLGLALCKIPSVVVSLTQSMMEIPAAREIILAHVKPVLKEELEVSFDAHLVTSELKPIKRIAELEQATGLDDFYDDEEHEPSLSEKIQDLENKLSNLEYRPSESPAIEIKQKTKTGKRAMHLIKALIDSGKDHLTRSQIREVLSDETLEDARLTSETSNPRRVIIDALNEAGKLCAKVIPDKKGYGRHEWRLLLRS
jgi:hypothetical protein